MIMSLDCIIWTVCGIVFLLFELMSSGLFFCLSLALGTIPAAACAWYGYDLFTQVVAFMGFSAISFFILYWRMGMKAHTHEHYKSAVDALPGKKGVVMQKIASDRLGQVQVGGQLWAAQAVNHQNIEQGSLIEVVRVEGVRLIVKSIQS